MSGKSYSIRGSLRPQLGSMKSAPKNLADGKIPTPPKPPNRVPSSISLKRYSKSQRG